MFSPAVEQNTFQGHVVTVLFPLYGFQPIFRLIIYAQDFWLTGEKDDVCVADAALTSVWHVKQLFQIICRKLAPVLARVVCT